MAGIVKVTSDPPQANGRNIWSETMNVSAQIDQRKIERRMMVARFRLSGIRNQRHIASEVGVSVATINRDFKALDAEWRERSSEDVAAAKGIDLDRLDRMIVALWDDAINGKWLAIDRILNLMHHRAKLLGLNAPEKREDTQRIEISMMVKRIAEESGLDEAEIMAEAHRILAATS